MQCNVMTLIQISSACVSFFHGPSLESLWYTTFRLWWWPPVLRANRGSSSGRGASHRKEAKGGTKRSTLERLFSQMTPGKNPCQKKRVCLAVQTQKYVGFFFCFVISHWFHHQDTALYNFSVIQIFHFDLMLLVYNVIFYITLIIKSWED